MLTDADRDNSTLVAVSEEMNNFSVVEVANSSTKNLPTQLMTTIALWELSGMLMLKRLRRLSRSWLFAIIPIKIEKTSRQLRISLLRLPMHTRLSQTLRRGQSMMRVALKECKRTSSAKDSSNTEVDTTTSEISLEVVVASTRNNKNKCSLTCLKTLTS